MCTWASGKRKTVLYIRQSHIQLNALGLIPGNSVPLDCEIVKILTQMYHDHGDVIAFQYGGSALVNTMDTYRGQNFQSRDVIETMRRYYSNSFTDYEKQSAINLFLGNFVSHQGKPTLWELENDFFLHNARHSRQMKGFNDNYIKWFHPEHLDMRKRLAIVKKRPLHDFNVKHSPLELTSFNALHQPAETGKSNENLCSPFCMDGSSL